MLILVCVAAVMACSACGEEEVVEQGGPDVIEPGVVITEMDDPVEEEEVQELFPDKGDKSTLEDMGAALAKVESYYFEQTMPFIDGSVFMQIWYKAPVMKVQTSVNGILNQVVFYDYEALTQLSYYPGSSSTGMLMSFDPANVDAPENPVLQDYSACEVLGFEAINRQNCMKLQAEDGTTLWVSTKYGFPLQVTFVDSLGEEYTVLYKNLVVNSVLDEDVAIPTDMEIIDMSGN